MKFLIKSTALLLTILCLGNSPIFAQNGGWSIGVGTGYMNYYGDLTPVLGDAFKGHYKIEPNDREFALGLFLEKRTSNGNAIVINANRGSIFANDLTAVDSTYRARSLNFYTKVRDLSATYVFRSDSKGLLGNRAFIAPYLFAGIGVTHFEVFGDLKDGDGNFYTHPKGVEQDGIYETNLTALQVEKDYQQVIAHIPIGVGLKLSTGRNWSLNVQTDIKYMLTDYLDDVAGAPRDQFDNQAQAYASNPNTSYSAATRGKADGITNDIYAFTSVSLRYAFGGKEKKSVFIPPIFPPSQNDLTFEEETMEEETEMMEDKMEDEGKSSRKDKRKAKKGDDETEVEDASEETGESEETEEESMSKDDVAEMVEAMMAEKEEERQAQMEEEEEMEEEREMRVEKEIEMEMPQQSGPAYGSKYDPTVEMYKLEVDRLRAANSDLKVEQRMKDLENQIAELKDMLGGGNNQNRSYNQGSGYERGERDGSERGYESEERYYKNDERYEEEEEGKKKGKKGKKKDEKKEGKKSKRDDDNETFDVTDDDNETFDVTDDEEDGDYSVTQDMEDMKGKKADDDDDDEEEEKKGLKKIFSKKDKDDDEADKKEKRSIMDRITGKNKDNEEEEEDDSISVDTYEFKFVGESIEVNRALKTRLKKIAKSAKKSDANIIFKALTTKQNESKTNTMVIKLAQILADDYGVDASKFTYQIKTSKMAPRSKDDSQVVTIQVIK